MRLYRLNRFEGTFIRELNSVHREGIAAVDLSGNDQYILSGGDDKLIKVWDSKASKNDPYYYQAFIGHTFPVKACMFKPEDNSVIYTAGEKDGIYVWKFYGNTEPKEKPEGHVIEPQYPIDRNALNLPTDLEKMRGMVKELKKPEILEGSFIVAPFQVQDELKHGMLLARRDYQSTIDANRPD